MDENVQDQRETAAETVETALADTQPRKKSLTLRRTLWWAGLILLSPASLVHFAKGLVTGLFANFPTPASPYTTTEAERFLCSLLLGFGCWFVVGMIWLFTFLESPPPETALRPPFQSNAHAMKRAFITVLTIVVLLMAAFTAFFLFIHIGIRNMHMEHPAI